MSGPWLAPSLRAACQRWSSRPALTAAGWSLTYRELWDRIVGLATAYRSLGITEGDRIVCQLPVVPEHVVAAAAAWVCGAVHVGADRDLTAPELAALAGRVRAAAVLCQPPSGAADPTAWLGAVGERAPSALRIAHDHDGGPGTHRLAELLTTPPADPPHPAGSADPALLLLTSGTTGRPKAVVETLPALWEKVRFFHDAVGCGPDDVHLMFLPIAHVFGLKLALMGLCTGGRVVLQERFSPGDALRMVGDEHVTVLPATPTHLTLLLRALDPDHRTGSLRWTVSAAAPLFPGLYDEVADRLGMRMLYIYGCSEGFLVRTTDPEEIRSGSVGREVFRDPRGDGPDGTVRILDPDSGQPVPDGAVGEVAFGTRDPVRYWDAPAAAGDGWYRTGDLGRLDPDGRLFLCGRLKEVVNRGGLKVAPREIEAVLERHPQVADCAVVPSPDPVLGEAVCACVVPSAGSVPSLEGLRDFLSGRLARHKLPDEVCVLDEIPRSEVGKIDRLGLAGRVAGDDLPRERLREPAHRGPGSGASAAADRRP